MKMKVFQNLFAFSLLLFFAGCSSGQKVGQITTHVKKGTFEKIVTATGELKAVKTEKISASTRGKIAYIVPEGTFVKKGDVVFRLESESLEEDLQNKTLLYEQAKADFQKAVEQAQLEKTRLELDKRIAEATLESAIIKLEDETRSVENKRTLFQEGLISNDDLIEAESLYNRAVLEEHNAKLGLEKINSEITSKHKILKFDEDTARAKLEKGKADYKIIKDRYEKSIARAPNDGYVIHISSWRGKPQVGQEVWRDPIAEIPDLSKMEVVLEVNEVDISQIKPGLEARIRIDSFPELTFQGTVSSLSAFASERRDREWKLTGLKTFDVKVAIENTDERMRPGMSSVANIILEHEEDVLLIPCEALLQEDDTSYVFKKASRSFEKSEVTIGSMNKNQVIVLEGLQEGDEISLIENAKTPE